MMFQARSYQSADIGVSNVLVPLYFYSVLRAGVQNVAFIFENTVLKELAETHFESK